MDDNETTVQQLLERISRSIHFMESIDRWTLMGRNGERSDCPSQPAWEAVSRCLRGGLSPLLLPAPNAYFHANAAFAILRHNGVPIRGLFSSARGSDVQLLRNLSQLRTRRCRRNVGS